MTTTLKITSFLLTSFCGPERRFPPPYFFVCLTEMVHTINSGREEVQLHREFLKVHINSEIIADRS